jgi:CDP-diacylglycerol--glycerol-3-phosphate 3-phosphatidyltransferase
MSKAKTMPEVKPLTVSGSDRINLPNAITLVRLALIPVFMAVFAAGASPRVAVLAAGIFGLASLTDWLDGYMARRRKQITDLGKLLDPIADKVLILAALIVLVEAGRAPGWLVVVILAREFAVTALRAVAAVGGLVLAAESMGKMKMVFQTVAVFILILEPALPAWTHTLGLILLLAATVLALWSGVRYAMQYGRSSHHDLVR